MESIKTAVNLKNENSATIAHDLLIKLFTISNRVSIASNTQYLFSSSSYPYMGKFSTGNFRIDYDTDMLGVTKFFLDMVKFQDILANKNEINPTTSNVLRGYLKFLKLGTETDFIISMLTNNRSITEDVAFIMRATLHATHTRRKIEKDVLNIMSNNDFLIRFDSEFLTYGMEYILPRFKEGLNAQMVVETIISELSDKHNVSSWKGKYSKELHAGKRSLINRTLSKIMFSNKFVAITHSKFVNRKINKELKKLTSNSSGQSCSTAMLSLGKPK